LKALLFKGLAAAAVVAAIVVPAASAGTHALTLSVLPLPKTALGPAKSLPLESDSGAVSNAEAASRSLGGATASLFANFGRFGGYVLDYGVGPSGGSGVTEISTEVDHFVQARGAKEDLDFWKADDPRITQLNQGGFGVTNRAVAVPKVGGSRFAFLTTFSASNIQTLYTVDEQFTQGTFEADVSVSAGSASAAESLAPKLAKTLDARIEQALAGKLKAKPVKVPAKPKAGPVAGSPDLTSLVLKTSDLSGTATVADQSYLVDPLALSDYGVLMTPAGAFVLLDQEVEWFATANQAAFEADDSIAGMASAQGSSAVDMSAVGDGAQGVITGPPTGNFGLAVLNVGRLTEFIQVGSDSAIQASDLQSVTQKAANYINSAGLGS